MYRRIGRRIAELRRLRGWSQEALAERVDRNASYLARIEAGKRKATIDTLDAIAEALGEPIGALFPGAASLSRLPGELDVAVRGLAAPDLLLLAKVAARFVRAPGRKRRPARGRTR